MRLLKILSIVMMFVIIPFHYVAANVMDGKIVKPIIMPTRPSIYDKADLDANIIILMDEFSIDFATPQGIAKIRVCDENGKEIESFAASTDAPIVWYMTDYEGYTITINTEYAEYVAEL